MMLLNPIFSTDATEAGLFGDAQTVEEYVREYYTDVPILAEVARCESTFRHYDSNGNIVRGIVNTSDVGVMQINTFYHEDTANASGYDLFTLNGNVGYARNLYEREGTAPWSASEFCWGDGQHLAKI